MLPNEPVLVWGIMDRRSYDAPLEEMGIDPRERGAGEDLKFRDYMMKMREKMESESKGRN